MYLTEQKLGTLFSSFSTLAIFVSCLGLLGLISYKTEARTKEIGVRKILGASGAKIVMLLSKEFLECILVATLIALPISYYAVFKWLQNFAYRTNISIWIFIASPAIALIIAAASICSQAVKAAAANPVDSLRYE